jgi:hypothetical protein
MSELTRLANFFNLNVVYKAEIEYCQGKSRNHSQCPRQGILHQWV